MERPEFEGKVGSKVVVEGMGSGTLMFYGMHVVSFRTVFAYVRLPTRSVVLG